MLTLKQQNIGDFQATLNKIEGHPFFIIVGFRILEDFFYFLSNAYIFIWWFRDSGDCYVRTFGESQNPLNYCDHALRGRKREDSGSSKNLCFSQFWEVFVDWKLDYRADTEIIK